MAEIPSARAGTLAEGAEARPGPSRPLAPPGNLPPDPTRRAGWLLILIGFVLLLILVLFIFV